MYLLGGVLLSDGSPGIGNAAAQTPSKQVHATCSYTSLRAVSSLDLGRRFRISSSESRKMTRSKLWQRIKCRPQEN